MQDRHRAPGAPYAAALDGCDGPLAEGETAADAVSTLFAGREPGPEGSFTVYQGCVWRRACPDEGCLECPDLRVCGNDHEYWLVHWSSETRFTWKTTGGV